MIVQLINTGTNDKDFASVHNPADSKLIAHLLHSSNIISVGSFKNGMINLDR
jgi:hypothetical protein